jgi:Trk K+ transport system NAD-binding subunit
MSSDHWRYRARRTVSRLRQTARTDGTDAPHHIVCGTDPLAFRLVEALKEAGARVTVVAAPRRRADLADIGAIPGVRVVPADRLDGAAFEAAGLATAQALALTDQDDVGNIHAALCAQDINPDVRLVIRMFNTSLGHGVGRLFKDCRVLSDAAMAAPTFVAAALGEEDPTHFRLAGRTVHIARRTDVLARDVICGLAQTAGRTDPMILPADEAAADLVLAEAGGRPAGTVVAARRLARLRRRRRPLAVALRAVRALVNRKIGMALTVTLGMVVVAGAVLGHTRGLHGWQLVYYTLLTTITGSQAEIGRGTVEQIAQVVLTVGGLALVPLITALVVDAVVNARLAFAAGRLRIPREGHVVVLGLGNVGTRVIRRLHDLGVEVVAIDQNPTARGAAVAKQLDIPMIVGDGAQEETLRAASVQTCQALVVLSTDDVSNLQAALNGRALRSDLRVVLRLFDGDFADRIQRAFNIDISRSVSYLAAPEFAAQMLKRDVVATLPVGRHAVLVAEVPVAPGSALDGAQIAAANRPQGVRVIALTQFGQPRPIWTPPPATRITSGDRLIVVARRAGHRWLVDQAASPTPAPDPMVG